MPFIDDYRLTLENDTQFRQRVAVAISRVIINAMPPIVASPPATHIALAKRFLLNPQSEVDRYLLPIAARMAISGASFTDDAALTTATSQVLVLNAALGVE